MGMLLRWGGAAVALSVIAFLLAPYELDLYRKMLFWVALAISYNFLFGVVGQMALSHFAFAGIGAYGVVMLMFKFDVPLVPAVALALCAATALAAIVAVAATRLSGFYLALATLAFAQLFIVVLNEGGTLTGSSGGITNYKLPAIFGYTLDGPSFVIVMILVVLATLAILVRVDRSWFGRASRAIRDNEEAAEAVGIDVKRIKIIVFTLTSVLAALAGMVYAFFDNIVNPPLFGIENAFMLLFMVIIGGTGSHLGAIVGAVLLRLLQDILEPFVGQFHVLGLGIIMVLVILLQPKGLVGIWDDTRRLRESLRRKVTS